MASRQFLQRSTSVARSFLSSTRKPNLNGIPTSTSTPRLSGRRNPLFSSRLPVELGCVQSLVPLHSATASSLLKSMLSSKVGQWGSMSEVNIGLGPGATDSSTSCSSISVDESSVGNDRLKKGCLDLRHHYNEASIFIDIQTPGTNALESYFTSLLSE